MKKTFEIDVAITPQELAEAFCSMYADEQSAFFDAVYNITRKWPGAGWCQQSCGIMDHIGINGRDAIRTLASHLPKEDIDYIIAASEDGA